MSDERASRRTVNLPRTKVVRFREKCAENGHIGSTLIYGWLWACVGRAQMGLPLPPADSQPKGDRLGMLWKQSDDEYSRWSAILRDAGTTVRDCVGEIVDCYLEADGDLAAAGMLAFRKLGHGSQDAPRPYEPPGPAQGQSGAVLAAAS